MQEQDTALWQVTCPCGWRAHGTREEVVAAVREHARGDHGQEITQEQAMGRVVRLDDA